MKLNVNRVLSGGLYSVSFSVGDFTADEVKKMESFGVPHIKIMQEGPGNRRTFMHPLNRIGLQIRAVFSTEQEANSYQENVLGQIRQSMKDLRERTDDFTSTQEVDV
jgi:hypothetical protein